MDGPTDPTPPRKSRAVAVLVRDGRLLVIARDKRGQHYLVLPGGGVEPGETPRQAVERELVEETGLRSTTVRPLWTRADAGRTAHYFAVDDPGGEPVLGGPERAKAGPDNRYSFRWLTTDDLQHVPLRPAGIGALLRAALTVAPPSRESEETTRDTP